MAPQNESDKKPGNDQVEGGDQESRSEGSGSAQLESGQQHYEPFSDADPFRPDRISQIRSANAALLQSIQTEPVGFENLTTEQYRSIYSDVEERTKWSSPTQDAFIGILRLGRKTPARGKRVL